MNELAPREVRQGRHRLRADAGGLTIVHGRRSETMPWDDVRALGVDHPPSYLLVYFAFRLGPWLWWLRQPCLHVGVRGEARPRLTFAIRFSHRSTLRATRHHASDRAVISAALGEWVNRVPTVCPETHEEFSVWWYGQRDAHPTPSPKPPPEPTTSQRAAVVHDDVDRLRAELARIRRRPDNESPRSL
jgi:hypothetical protein